MRDLANHLNSELRQRIDRTVRVIVSEPIGKIASAWQAIPHNSYVPVQGDEIETRPFAPRSPFA